MHLTNPFQDQDFAKYQVNCGKAKIEIIDDQIIYIYPLFSKYTILYTNKNISQIKDIAQKNNSIYTIIETTKISKPHKKKKQIRELIPRHTNIIDLDQTEDTILSNMHQKGRYNTRVAKKHNLTIQESTNTESFYKILEETAKRDNFYINPPQFYQEMLQTLPQDKVKLFLAFHPDSKEPIAGIINTYIGNTCTYYYGASDHTHRKYMAPYLLQWHAIQDAKNKGFKYYDFLGIADPYNPKDPLQGVTNFKTKFSKNIIQFQDGETIIHKPLLYFLLKIKKLIT